MISSIWQLKDINNIQMKILFVCLGNICRSPLGEGILRELTEAENLAWTIDSAGTSGWHVGEGPDPRSVAIAQRHGIDISDQISRRIKKEDLEDFDLILTMDDENQKNVLRLCTREDLKEKVKKIMSYVHPNAIDVPDPYYMADGFGQVYDMLYKACQQLITENR